MRAAGGYSPYLWLETLMRDASGGWVVHAPSLGCRQKAPLDYLVVNWCFRLVTHTHKASASQAFTLSLGGCAAPAVACCLLYEVVVASYDSLRRRSTPTLSKLFTHPPFANLNESVKQARSTCWPARPSPCNQKPDSTRCCITAPKSERTGAAAASASSLTYRLRCVSRDSADHTWPGRPAPC
jgi:hypothetical protein